MSTGTMSCDWAGVPSDECYPDGPTFSYGDYSEFCMNHYLKVTYYEPHPKIAERRGEETFYFRGVEVPTASADEQIGLFDGGRA